MGYTQTTYDQLVDMVSVRLNDPSNRFWRRAEVQAYVLETLRTWQAFSAFTSTRVSITTTTDSLYALNALVSELIPTITDRDIITQIQRHLQEPISATSWIGTEQFTFAQVVQSIQRRRDKFFVETGLTQSFTSIAVPFGNGSVELTDSMIDVIRAVWVNQAGVRYILFRDDQFSLTGESSTWFTVPGVPSDYSTVLQTPIKILLAPPPAANGTLEMLTINSGPNLNPAVSATVLGVPDDLAWVIKFGALGDLFGQDGPGKDSERAAYCESRWREGIALARIYNVVRFGYMNGVPAFVDSLIEQDSCEPSWMNSTAATIKNLSVSGMILGVNPPPTAGQTIMLDITPKMPMPTVGADYVQVGKESLDAIVDYAQHLATIKEGISEINATSEQYKNLIRLAAVTNDRLRANSNNFDVLSDRSLREYHETPRRKSDISKEELDYKPDVL